MMEENVPPITVSTAIDTGNHCAFCLRHFANGSQSSCCNSSVEVVEVPFPTITSIRHLWPYLKNEDVKEDDDNISRSSCFFFQRSSSSSISALPRVCVSCYEEILKFDMIHRELETVKMRLEAQVGEIRKIIADCGRGGLHAGRLDRFQACLEECSSRNNGSKECYEKTMEFAFHLRGMAFERDNQEIKEETLSEGGDADFAPDECEEDHEGCSEKEFIPELESINGSKFDGGYGGDSTEEEDSRLSSSRKKKTGSWRMNKIRRELSSNGPSKKRIGGLMDKTSMFRMQPCDMCMEEFPVTEIREHLVEKHVTADYIYDCPYFACGYAFISPIRLNKVHLTQFKSCQKALQRSLKDYSNLSCELCDFQTNNLAKWRLHLDRFHENLTKELKCPVYDCYEHFTVRQSVEYHLLSHVFSSKNSQRKGIHHRQKSHSKNKAPVSTKQQPQIVSPPEEVQSDTRGCDEESCRAGTNANDDSVKGRRSSKRRRFIPESNNESSSDSSSVNGNSSDEGWRPPSEKRPRSSSRRKKSILLGNNRKPVNKEGNTRGGVDVTTVFRTQPCDVCMEEFPVTKIRDHLMEKHVPPDYIYDCPYFACGYAFISPFRLKKIHLKQFKTCQKSMRLTPEDCSRHSCDLCDFETNNILQLKNHVERFHENVQTTKNIKCPIYDCSQHFSVRQSVEYHLLSHVFSELSTNLSAESPPLLKEKPVKCDMCDNKFSTIKQLQFHQANEHGVPMGVGFVCKTCNKFFSSKTALEVHERRHSSSFPDGNWKPYVCDRCGKGYTDEDRLKVHISVVHQKQPCPSVCETCGKGFSNAQALKTHISGIHLGIKEFVCTTCGRAFNNNQTLKEHVARHTGERPYACKFCGQPFRQLRGLKTHEESHADPNFAPKGPLPARTGPPKQVRIYYPNRKKKRKRLYCID